MASIFPYLHSAAAAVYLLLTLYIIVNRRRFPAVPAAALALFGLLAESVGNLMALRAANAALALVMYRISLGGLLVALACFWWFIAAFSERERLLRALWFRVLVFLPPLALFALIGIGQVYATVSVSAAGYLPVFSSSPLGYVYFLYYALAPIVVLIWLFRERRQTRSSLKRRQLAVIARGLAVTAILATAANIAGLVSALSWPPVENLAALIAAISVVYAIAQYSSRDLTAAYAAEDIIATMSESLILLDMSGHVVFVNRAAEQLLGVALPELTGQSLSRLVTEPDFRNKVVSQAAVGKRIVEQAVEVVRRSGKTTTASLSTTTLTDKDGNMTGIICLIRDVTELKRTQSKLKERAEELEANVLELEQAQAKANQAVAELKQTEQKLESEHRKVGMIISNLMDPVILIDPDGRLVHTNPAAAATFGLSDADIGVHIEMRDNYSFANFKDLIKREYKVKTWRELNTGNPNEEEVTVTDKKGDATYKVTTVTIRDRRRYIGTMKVFYNLTREKMVNKMKSEFITIAAHQMRTPLAAVKWSIRMVMDGEAGAVGEEQRELLQKGITANERIISLVNDMLTVARIEEGRYDFAFAVNNFSLVLETAREQVAALAKERKLTMSVEQPDVLPSFFFDKDRLAHAIGSILDNAVKYTPVGGTVALIVGVTKKTVKVAIRDSGIGITPGDLPRLYEKFFRGRNVLLMQTGGTGLGLFTARNIIERHGGTIAVKSELNKGTEVTLIIPIKQPA